MPRKDFLRDLRAAQERIQIVGISHVQPAGDDGEFNFQCDAGEGQFEISALVGGAYLSLHLFYVSRIITLACQSLITALPHFQYS
jgi:hypothetical protein